MGSVGMGGRAIGACVMAGLLLTVSSPVTQARSGTGKHQSCAPRGTHVLASDRYAEVYRKTSGASYACLRRTGHRVRLVEPGCWDGLRNPASLPALGGTVVAYCRYNRGDEIIVRSIRTGRVLHSFSLHVEIPRQTMLEWAEARQIVVAPDGAVAWLQEDSFGRHGGATPPPSGYDVYAVDSLGFHALSTNLSAEPQALKLVGSMLTWREGTTLKSAVLG